MIYSGKFKVTSPFGMRTLNGVREDHRGIDVVGLEDKYICAVVSGTVAVSAIIRDKNDLTWQWGNYVRVDGDDGRKYYYCHMSRRLVSAGRRVKAGDHLGIEGNTGYSFGSHCHFEVRDRAGNSVDPARAVSRDSERGRDVWYGLARGGEGAVRAVGLDDGVSGQVPVCGGSVPETGGMRWLKKLLTTVLLYIAVYLPFVVLMQALTGYDYTGAYAAVTGVGAVELLVGGVIKVAEEREERKRKEREERESGELETEADEP